MARRAARSRVSGIGWRNCHKMIRPEDISTMESRPKPTSAIEEAMAPAEIATIASIAL